MPVAHQRGRGNLQVNRAEQLPVDRRLVRRHHVRGSRGQPDHHRCAHPRHRLLAADPGHVDVAEHDELHVVELVRAGCRVPNDDLRQWHLEIAAARSWHEQQPADRMVDEACTDTRQVDDRGDAELVERPGRPDARAQQDRRRADRPRRQRDPTPADDPPRLSVHDLDTDDSMPLQ